MSDEPKQETPFLRGPTGEWDWWGENPAEIVLVVFLLVAFFFFYSLPSQGWGIDGGNPNVPAEDGTAQAGE